MAGSTSAHTVAVIYNHEDPGGEAVLRGVVDGVEETRETIAALGHQVFVLRVDEGVGALVRALEAVHPAVVVNLCEGYRASSAGQVGIAALLDLLGLPYTGSGPVALGLALDKALAKQLLMARGLPTPRFAVYHEPPARLLDLRFPLILKLAAEDASLGITADNVVADAAACRRRLGEMLDEFHAPVMVEEFIDGREFTVPLLDGEPLLVEEIELLVEPRIVGFRAKWETGSDEYRGTRAVFAPALEDQPRRELMAIATTVWEAIGMRDYARVDFRMDAAGRIYVLEANPNPDISAGSGYRQALALAGWSYADFLGRLIDNALKRRGAGNTAG